MNEQEFKQSVIHSSEALLDMMNRNPAAYMKTAHLTRPPRRSIKTPGLYRLYLDDFVRDGAEVYSGEQRIPGIEVQKLYMKKAEKYADVFVPEASSFAFESTDWKQLSLRTDMRFLIERMRDFYNKHSFSFFPPPPDPVPEGVFSLSHPLSASQQEAVDTVLSSPVAYIWGAPGTGKTQSVLAACLLRYIMAKRRVLLLAPTNNAVEQSLYGILPLLEMNGIPLTKVYRLGTASAEFALRFPEVVGDRSLEQRSEELTERMASLSAELEKVHTHAADVASAQKRLSDIDSASILIESKSKLLSNAIEDVSSATLRYQEIKERLTECQARYDDANSAFSQRESLIHQYRQSIEKNQKRCRIIRFLPWKRPEYKRLHLQNQQLDEQMQAIMLTLNAFIAERDSAETEYALAQKSETEAFSLLEQKRNEQTVITNDINQCCDRLGVPSLVWNSPAEILSVFTDFCNKERQFCETLIGEKLRDFTEIEKDLKATEEERKQLGSTSKLEQFEKAIVVAATFDTAIGHLPKLENAEPYHHAFIDEAGYVSLVRGITAFVCGCPVSFFGDHFQLPPICEMSKQEIINDHPDVSIWAVPVIAYSDMINHHLPDILSLLDQPTYAFDQLNFLPLIKSYRFGTQLASALDSHIYHTNGRFEGVAQTTFEILTLHGSKRRTDIKRTSREEALAIRSYLQENQLDEGSYIILAPYNKQIELLKSLIPNERNNILSVHRSQGMEWDTVILSVCDTKDAYFVNSDLMIGKCVLNTAISRAKRRLVIACDTAFWSLEYSQLIGDLITKDAGPQYRIDADERD